MDDDLPGVRSYRVYPEVEIFSDTWDSIHSEEHAGGYED
jgi:hypothetical protein